MIYDQAGDLAGCVIISGKTHTLGYAYGFPNPQLQIAAIEPGEKLDEISWKKEKEYQEIISRFTETIPTEKAVGFEIIGKFLCLTSHVPIMGEIYNRTSNAMETVQLGFVRSVQKLDTPFAERLSGLTDTHINLYTGNRLSVGTLNDYSHINSEPAIYTERTGQTEPGTIVYTDVTVNACNYFQAVLPIAGKKGTAAAIVSLYSKEKSRRIPFKSSKSWRWFPLSASWP